MLQRDIMDATPRFMRRIRMLDGCWLWPHAYKNGYGYIRVGGRGGSQITVRRFAWLRFKGPIPSGRCILLTCDSRMCVNPAHLLLGTREDRIDAATVLMPRGELAGGARLTEREVREIRNSARHHDELAVAYGVSHQAITALRRRETWRHI